MGMVFHGVADDVGDFVEASVVHPLHGVQDTSLDGFESIVDVRNGAFQNDIGGIVHEVVGIHAFHCPAGWNYVGWVTHV